MANSILTGFFQLFSPAKVQVLLQDAAIAQVPDPLDRWAIVLQMIQPGQKGRVRFESTDWFGVCLYHVFLPPGTPVRVVGISNTTLIVEPVMSVFSNPAVPSISV